MIIQSLDQGLKSKQEKKKPVTIPLDPEREKQFEFLRQYLKKNYPNHSLLAFCRVGIYKAMDDLMERLNISGEEEPAPAPSLIQGAGNQR